MYAPYGGGTSHQLAALFQSLAGIPGAMVQGKFATQQYDAAEQAKELERQKFDLYNRIATGQEDRAAESHAIGLGGLMAGAEPPPGFMESMPERVRGMFAPGENGRIPARFSLQDQADLLYKFAAGDATSAQARRTREQTVLDAAELQAKIRGLGAFNPQGYGRGGGGGGGNDLANMLALILMTGIKDDPRSGSVLPEDRRSYMQDWINTIMQGRGSSQGAAQPPQYEPFENLYNRQPR